MPKLTLADIPQRTATPTNKVRYRWGSDIEEHLQSKRKRVEKGVNLNPDYQRGHVWSLEDRIKYVEFRLRGGQDLTPLAFNMMHKDKDDLAGPLELVDGLQRLTTSQMFMRGEFSVFGGHTIADLNIDFSNGLDVEDSEFRWSLTFDVVTNHLASRAEVLQWYLDINDTGVTHEASELKRVRGLIDEALEAEAAPAADGDDFSP